MDSEFHRARPAALRARDRGAGFVVLSLHWSANMVERRAKR
ncbi:MAG: hypothetical protein ACREMD_00095 [Gemmatimonadota bacterium]